MNERYETFTGLIWSIDRSIHKIKDFEMAEFGLKGNQVECLLHLYLHKDGLTAGKLCELCGEDKAAISRSIKFLNSKGCVNLEAGQKKYRNKIRLTPKGQQIVKSMIEKIDRIFACGGEGFPESEREMFYNSLTLIADNLSKICYEYGEKND